MKAIVVALMMGVIVPGAALGAGPVGIAAAVALALVAGESAATNRRSSTGLMRLLQTKPISSSAARMYMVML